MKFKHLDYKIQNINEGRLSSKEMDEIEKYLFSLKSDDKKFLRKELMSKFKKLSDKDIDLFLELI